MYVMYVCNVCINVCTDAFYGMCVCCFVYVCCFMCDVFDMVCDAMYICMCCYDFLCMKVVLCMFACCVCMYVCVL